MLPISVIVPTKNSAAFLPEHLTSMQPWLDLAAEVLAVDSFSTDGTPQLLQAGLRHPRLKLLQHPPGLYASWNYGVSQASSPYIYISTVGDSITREGFERLASAAETLDCDVLLSKPSFRNLQGQPLADPCWPVDDMIRLLSITQPRRLERLQAVVFAVTSVVAAMTGSCASDLFRRETLLRFPFPTGFGTAGDAAWGILHAADVTWGIEPARFSSFLTHPTNASEAERQSYRQAPRLDQVARQAVAAVQRAGILPAAQSPGLQLDQLLDAVSAYLDRKAEYDQHRRGRLPWILRPRAWSARLARSRANARWRCLREWSLRALDGVAVSPLDNNSSSSQPFTAKCL